jgi:hypothetical protein
LNVLFEMAAPDVPTASADAVARADEFVPEAEVLMLDPEAVSEGISALSRTHVPAVAPGFKHPLHVTFESFPVAVDDVIGVAGCGRAGCDGAAGYC